MDWYLAEQARKNLRQVVVELDSGGDVDSKFDMLVFGRRYVSLMIAPWTAGFFRLDRDPGTYLLVRGDGAVDDLRGSPMRLAFSFYRWPTGAVFAMHVDVDCPAVMERLIHPQVLFETVENPDDEETSALVGEALSGAPLHLCFAEGSGSGEVLDGTYTGPPLFARFDVVASMPPECRTTLRKEWASLLAYQRSISPDRRNFRVALKQMRVENPLNTNPVEPRDRSSVIARLAEAHAGAVSPHVGGDSRGAASPPKPADAAPPPKRTNAAPPPKPADAAPPPKPADAAPPPKPTDAAPPPKRTDAAPPPKPADAAPPPKPTVPSPLPGAQDTVTLTHPVAVLAEADPGPPTIPLFAAGTQAISGSVVDGSSPRGPAVAGGAAPRAADPMDEPTKPAAAARSDDAHGRASAAPWSPSMPDLGGSSAERGAPFWSGSLFDDPPSEERTARAKAIDPPEDRVGGYGAAVAPLHLPEDELDGAAPLRAGTGGPSTFGLEPQRSLGWWRSASFRAAAVGIVGVLVGTAGTYVAMRQDGAERASRLDTLRREASDAARGDAPTAPAGERAARDAAKIESAGETGDAPKSTSAAMPGTGPEVVASKAAGEPAAGRAVPEPTGRTTADSSKGPGRASAEPDRPPTRVGDGGTAQPSTDQPATPATPVVGASTATRPGPVGADLPSRDQFITLLRNSIAAKMSGSARAIPGASAVVRVSFKSSGMLESAGVVQRSGHPEFDEEVLRALRASQPFGVVSTSEAARRFAGLTFLVTNPGVEDSVEPGGGAFPSDRPLPERARPVPATTESTGAQAMYEAARQLVKSGSPLEARTRLEELLRRHPDSAYAPKAMYEIAGILQRSGDGGSARDTYADLVRRYPNSAEGLQARRFLAAPR